MELCLPTERYGLGPPHLVPNLPHHLGSPLDAILVGILSNALVLCLTHVGLSENREYPYWLVVSNIVYFP